DRFDGRFSSQTAMQLNVLAAVSEFQTPNTYDQQDAGQDQRQQQQSVNIAPSLTHTLSRWAVIDAHAWFRRDRVQYEGSDDQLSDRPAALARSEERRVGKGCRG